MENNRRKFLRDSAALVVLFSLPSLPGFGNEPKMQFNSSTFQAKELEKSIFEDLIKAYKNKSPLVLGVDQFDKVKGYNRKVPESLRVSVALFGDDLYRMDSESLSESVSNSNIPLVNSNLDITCLENQSLVQPYTIRKSEEKKIGIIGISFADPKQSFLEIATMANEKAEFLKSEKFCDEVLCMVENPEKRFPLLSVSDFISETSKIDSFFSISDKIKETRLYAYPDKNGKTAFLQLRSKSDKEIGVILNKDRHGTKIHQIIKFST
ncbi:hypothetical protein [Algoriphagus sediminis]|uniref:Uncharacterized protein n=1 Tax=Algoriphagus sediminis TaxID=3057113 RepID=A0ABT7Y7L2_9BACT|nr:hypothetical protein [Algoriphagus sediminis]MDN3202504.1 hypothetical protein [Algoriphagus sediminis]